MKNAGNTVRLTVKESDREAIKAWLNKENSISYSFFLAELEQDDLEEKNLQKKQRLTDEKETKGVVLGNDFSSSCT